MFVEIAVGLVTLVVVFCLYVRFYKWTYFKRNGTFQIPPKFPFGSFNDVFLGKKHANETALELYKMASGHKVYGYYFLGARLIGITDPELIRRVLVKDFDHFVDRQKNMFMEISTSKTDEAWSRQMTSLTGDEWKEVRSTFSPIFTSGKMKAMMVFIRETSKRLVEEFGKHAEADLEFELKDVFGKFSMDTIASCAFGVDAQSFSSTGINKLFKYGGFSVFKPKETQFFMDVVQTTLRNRLQESML